MKRATPFLLMMAVGCAPKGAPATAPAATPAASPVAAAPTPIPVFSPEPGEKHLANLRRLSYGDGENAEAYWSFDGRAITLQTTRGGAACDRIWRIDDPLGKASFTPVSSGEGRTTCSFFFPDGKKILYASTHASSKDCPPKPDMSKGYVWALYPSYDIYRANPDGSALEPLLTSSGYDAEATICKDGSIVFTSTRDGDIDLYRADADGKNVKRLTDAPGYDGGAFFSPDCKQIVWRASRPEGKDLDEYRSLLKENLVKPTKLEIFVMNADGSNKRQVTHLGAASFAPFFFPDGKRIIFATNKDDPTGRNFDLWMVNADGSGLERVTTYDGFDAFPMFSPDGKHLAFSSNRFGSGPHETNVFVADWVE